MIFYIEIFEILILIVLRRPFFFLYLPLRPLLKLILYIDNNFIQFKTIDEIPQVQLIKRSKEGTTKALWQFSLKRCLWVKNEDVHISFNEILSQDRKFEQMICSSDWSIVRSSCQVTSFTHLSSLIRLSFMQRPKRGFYLILIPIWYFTFCILWLAEGDNNLIEILFHSSDWKTGKKGKKMDLAPWFGSNHDYLQVVWGKVWEIV